MAATKKFRAIWDNRFFDAAALTASSQVSTLPVQNLQDPMRELVWRSEGLTNISVTANLGTPSDPDDLRPPVQALALLNHNLTADAKVRLQASLSPEFCSLLLDEEFDAWGYIAGAGEGGAGGPFLAGGKLANAHRSFYTPSPLRVVYPVKNDLEAKGYWKIAFTDPGNPDGYIQMGRIFLTFYDDFKSDWAYPWFLGGKDESEIIYNPSGVPWTDPKAFRRCLRFVWNERFSDEDKYWRFFFMVMNMGRKQDWIIDPISDRVSARHFTTLYGRFREISEEMLRQWAKGFSDLEIIFEESL